MAELGESGDPRDLIPGDANEIRKSTVHLTVYGDTLIGIGQGFQKLDSDGWKGPAGDAFRSRAEPEPGRWITAGDAFHAAAAALNAYSHTLDWAQGQAWDAIVLWNKANDASRTARQQHDAQTRTAQQQAEASGQPAPPEQPFADPGEAQREQARGMLANARANLDYAGNKAAATLDRAQQDAPEERTFLESVVDNVGDAVGDIADNVVHAAGDIVEDVGGAAGAVVHDVGDMLGSKDIHDAGATVTSATHDAGSAVRNAGDVAGQWVHQRGVDARAFLSGIDPGPNGPHYVIVDQGKYPEAANHVREAQMGTSWRGDQPFNRMQPAEVTIDRDGADARRAESMKQVPQTRPGYDRDEYPPAVFQEGGTGSSVKYIDPFDNQGSGSTIRHQISGLNDGEKVTVVAD